MTRCHAFWSFGTVAGALIGGAVRAGAGDFLTQQLIVQPVFAAATVFFALRLIPTIREPEQAAEARLRPAAGWRCCCCAWCRSGRC